MAPSSSVKVKEMRSRATPTEIQQLLSQVSRDLAPWKESGITLEMVEKAYCTEEIIESMRIQVGPRDVAWHCKAGRWEDCL